MTQQSADRQTSLIQEIVRKLRVEADAKVIKGNLFGRSNTLTVAAFEQPHRQIRRMRLGAPMRAVPFA